MLGELSTVNPKSNLDALQKKHQQGTGEWFIKGTEFEAWKASIHGVL
jgi:hypothetical protein